MTSFLLVFSCTDVASFHHLGC